MEWEEALVSLWEAWDKKMAESWQVFWSRTKPVNQQESQIIGLA